MADQPGDLARCGTGSSPTCPGRPRGPATRPLSSQQRAFLRLTRPLGLIDGTALLAAPSEFAKDAIERILRRPISDALGRHLGVTRQPRRRRRRRRGAPAAPRCPTRPGGRSAQRARPAAPAGPTATLAGGWPGARRRCPPARHRTARRRCRARDAASGCRRPEPADGRTDAGRRRRVPTAGRTTCRPPTSPPAASEVPAAVADPAQREVHLRHVRHRRVQPVQPRRGRRRGRGAGARVQPAVHLGRLRAGQDPPAARGRALRPAAVPRHAGALRVHRGVHQRLHQLACATTARWRSSAATATSTCCWWTTSSSWRARKAPRRSSSTPSTPCTTRTSRSSCPRTGRPSGWRPSRTGCARGSSGA